MKKFFIYILTVILFTLVGCGNVNNTNSINNGSNNSTGIGDDYMNKELVLKIGDDILDVTWQNNNSINDLKKLAKDGLNISMHMYGGFEQVGSIGKTISSNDSRMTTDSGDIVLYSSNQIVLFYGTNTWEYTKLGHINLSKEELKNILGNGNININISLK